MVHDRQSFRFLVVRYLLIPLRMCPVAFLSIMGFGVVLVDLSTSEIEFEFVGDLRSLTGLLLVFFVPLIVVWWVVSSSSCPDPASHI